MEELLGGRLRVTARARAVMRGVTRDGGPQVMLLSWPAGLTYLSAELFTKPPFDVIVGHVARCPVYADVRQLALFRNRLLILDGPRTELARRHPVLSLRTASVTPSGIKVPV